MKFFRKHKKAVSPVIAVMLLVAVAVAAVGAYFIWFRSFQTQTQKSVQETSEGALGGGLQVLSISDDGENYYMVIKNTLGSGSITLADAITVTPGGQADINGTAPTIAPGAASTITVIPDVSWDLETGKTRTFTIKDTGNVYVVTPTYTDS